MSEIIGRHLHTSIPIMLTRKTTLVLGAGSSVSFGYPVGAALRTQILALAHPENQRTAITAGLYAPEGMLVKFADEFRESQLDSIDKFLARRAEYSDIGKRAIATVLLACERRSALFEGDSTDLWLRYLFNQLEAESWDKVDLSNLSVITFNYDRSLEHYLMWALMRAYGQEQQAAIDKLRTMRVAHIYGTLGPVWPGEDGYIHYGEGATRNNVEVAAKSIRIIPEGRADGEELAKAQQWLSEADAIAFLGFGFDKTNLDRLKTRETCVEDIVHSVQGHMTRPVVATCKGMTLAERRKAHRDVAAGKGRGYAAPYEESSEFKDCDCLTLLRETLVLR